MVTESQTFKKRSDFQSNDDYAVYVRENIQVRRHMHNFHVTVVLLVGFAVFCQLELNCIISCLLY